MSNDTLRYIRHDTTRRFGDGKRTRAGLMGNKVVNLDGNPASHTVRAVLLGVACDRGVGLGAGRIGSADGPMRFRDAFWRTMAPEGWGPGALLDAGDLVSAGRTDETHARLSEVVAVLRGRFPQARLVVVGGGQDALYGDVLGFSRWCRKEGLAGRLGLVHVDAQPDASDHEGEPHDRTALRRILREPAAGIAGEDVVAWGLQQVVSQPAQLEFLRNQGVTLHYQPDHPGKASLTDEVDRLLGEVDGLSMSVDLGAFSQAVAPGVSEPIAIGIDPGQVARALGRLGAAERPTSVSIWGLNPRFDRDGATARLAARLAWSYVCGRP
ncbi:MAG: arginase family protein [Deltaproteobacteria bacterium]|nr:arginase family protein [Deltaproteobacteria bacterium]